MSFNSGDSIFIYFFFRFLPGFCGFSFLPSLCSNPATKSELPSGRPVRECLRIFSNFSFGNAPERNCCQSPPRIESRGSTFTSFSFFPAMWANALLHGHLSGDVTSFARIGLFSIYRTQAIRYGSSITNEENRSRHR